MGDLSYNLYFTLFFILFQSLRSVALSLPQSPNKNVVPIQARQDSGLGTPSFPPDPPSCPKCAESFGSINSCAAAAPVLANFSMVIFNPGAFIDIIKCACTDTFQAAYPQCADWSVVFNCINAYSQIELTSRFRLLMDTILRNILDHKISINHRSSFIVPHEVSSERIKPNSSRPIQISFLGSYRAFGTSALSKAPSSGTCQHRMAKSRRPRFQRSQQCLPTVHSLVQLWEIILRVSDSAE